MGERKGRTPELIVGLDLGDKYCETYVLDGEGEVVERGKVRTREAVNNGEEVDRSNGLDLDTPGMDRIRVAWW